MSNNRVFYAIEQVAIAPVGTTGAGSFTASYTLHGLQSCGVNTKFNLEQAFELGQVSIYENIENIPDVEITLQKVLDGYPLAYHQATRGAGSATLSGRSAVKTTVAFSIFSDVQDAASGTPVAEAIMSGVFPSAITYTFPVNGNFTEDLTLVGNNKTWNVAPTGGYFFTGQFNNNDSPLAGEGINRRQHITFGSGTNCCLLPYGGGGIPGITSPGYNLLGADGNFGAHVQSIKISTDLGRTQLNELGRKGPYYRFIEFPVQVKTDIEVLAHTGDLVQGTEAGILGSGNNLSNQNIFVATTEGTKINCGTKNKLDSVNYTGGAAQKGSNVTITFSYVTFNDMTVTHPQDPTVGLAQ